MTSEFARVRNETWIYVSIVSLLPFIIFWPVTLGRQIWATGDFSAYHYPLFVVIAEQWRQGVIPLWNPYLDGGTPLVAAQQGAVFYPINLLLWFLLRPWAAMGFSNLIHLGLIGLGAFLFLRSLKLHPMAALLGGLVLAYGGFAMSHLGHVGIVRVLPWLGFSLLGFNSWIESGKRCYLFCVFVATAFLLLSGYPQVIVYALFFVSTYLLFVRTGASKARLCGFLALILGIGASGIQLAPGMQLWFAREYIRPGEGMFEPSMGYSFHPAYLATLLFPRARTGTFAEMVGYIGVAPLILALISIFQMKDAKDTRVKRFFVVWTAISLILSFGRFVPVLAEGVFHIPIYGSLGVPSKHLLEFSFSMAVLSAYGFDGLIKKDPFRSIRLKSVLVIILVVGVATLMALFSSFAEDTPPLKWSTAEKTVFQPLFLVLITGLLLGVLVASKQRYRQGAAIGLIALSLFDLLDFGLPIYSHELTSPAFYEQAPESAKVIQQRADNQSPFRVVSFEATGSELGDRELAKELLATNYNASYKLESVTGHDGLMLRRVLEAFKGKIPPWGFISVDAVEEEQFRSALDLYGVRYLLVRSAKASPLSKYYEPFHHSNEVTVFENPRARSRLFPMMNPQNGIGNYNEVGASERVSLLSYDGDRLAADVFFGKGGTLVHSASYVPGWRAKIDGVATPVFPAGEFLQGISVPQGKHRVEMWYEPDSLKWGGAISALSVGLIGILCFWPKPSGYRSA